MNKLSIKTPRGGHELWVLLLTKDDDIIGNVKFNDYESLIKFKNAYSSLPTDSWGTVELSFDIENPNERH